MNVQTGVIIISVLMFSSSYEGATVKDEDGGNYLIQFCELFIISIMVQMK